jgi:hypothetical protein
MGKPTFTLVERFDVPYPMSVSINTKVHFDCKHFVTAVSFADGIRLLYQMTQLKRCTWRKVGIIISGQMMVVKQWLFRNKTMALIYIPYGNKVFRESIMTCIEKWPKIIRFGSFLQKRAMY